jgi:uncharacterized FlaG/YvyC family protein
MNGAELPSGAILQVQPADSSYKNSQQQPQTHYAPHNQKTNQQGGHDEPPTSDDKKVEGKQDDIDDDLDDFFGSLE